MLLTRLSQPGSQPHQLCDDLESFLHVLVYHCVQFQTHKIPKPLRSQLTKLMKVVFDQCEVDDDGVPTGGEGKMAFFQIATTHFNESTLLQFLSPALVKLIHELRWLFVPLYSDRPSRVNLSSLPTADEARTTLTSSDPLIKIFQIHLSSVEWGCNRDDQSDSLHGESLYYKLAGARRSLDEVAL